MMAYDGWNLLGGCRLVGDSLGGLIRWSYGFQNYGWFWNDFGDWIGFGTREHEGFRGRGGGGGGREPMDSNRSFPAMSTLRIVLEALEIFRHMLDASTYSSTTYVAYIQNLVGVLKDNLKNGNRTYPSYHPDISLLKLMSTHSKTKWRKFLTQTFFDSFTPKASDMDGIPKTFG